nr:uncharacterized protein LOC110438722 [Danio rerio]|eukprot:XP_021327479.1 uncharacterized protein LOC110438722 [Danio rerio]
MEHLNISLVLLLVFCSLSAGETFWTHLGTRCIGDCKTDGAKYKCKTIDNNGQCQTMFCSPKANMDYLGRWCHETSECKRGENGYFSCQVGLFKWGYCGLVRDDNKHFGNIGGPCQNYCGKKDKTYNWCNVASGTAYCSPSENTDYLNRPCKEDSPCEKHNDYYHWCEVEGSQSYCGLVEPKVFVHRTHYNNYCFDDCEYYESGDYYRCNIGNTNGWELCSPEVDVAYNGHACHSDHFCGLHGKTYNWCWTSETEHGYCGPVEAAECSYITSTNSSSRNSDNEPQKIVICTRVDKGKIIITHFSAEPASRDITDGIQFRHEVEKLTSKWHNEYLVDEARSNLISSANLRVDLQSPIIHNNQTYYNVHIRLNKARRARESTTVSQVLAPQGIPARLIRRAFMESLQMRARIYIDVSTLNEC